METILIADSAPAIELSLDRIKCTRSGIRRASSRFDARSVRADESLSAGPQGVFQFLECHVRRLGDEFDDLVAIECSKNLINGDNTY